MKKEMFEQLVASVKQAGKIHRGEASAARTFTFQPEDIRAKALAEAARRSA